MSPRPLITTTGPYNMGIPVLPTALLEIPGLSVRPILLGDNIVMAQGSSIYLVSASLSVLCSVNIEHPVTCLATFRLQGCDALVVGTEDRLLLLYSNIRRFIELDQKGKCSAKVQADHSIHIAIPSTRGNVTPAINGDASAYCVSLNVSTQYPLLAAGLDSGSCLLINLETFAVLAVLKGNGYGTFQPDFKKLGLNCTCSLVHDHFTDLLDHLDYLSQRRSNLKGTKAQYSMKGRDRELLQLDEALYMDQAAVSKLTPEKTCKRLRSMYYSLPTLCTACSHVYAKYLERIALTAAVTSNIPDDLYISTEVDVVPKPSRRKASSATTEAASAAVPKIKATHREVVTCFGPQANPSMAYLHSLFERNSHLGCTPDVATCLCWVASPEDAAERTISKTSAKFVTLLVGGEDFCICLYHIPVALLALANDSGIPCNCRPHMRFYTSALSTYQNESMIDIDESRPPVYNCGPLECQMGATMFDPVHMHGFINAYGDVEAIIPISEPAEDANDDQKQSFCARFAVKSTLDGYTFYELALNLIHQPLLDLTAYKDTYIPRFLLEMDTRGKDLRQLLPGIFPKQSPAAKSFMDHSKLYQTIISKIKENAQSAGLAGPGIAVKPFEVEVSAEPMLTRIERLFLPVYLADRWIRVDMDRGKYEYRKVLPCSSWSFPDVQQTAMCTQVKGINLLADFNRCGQVSFYSLTEISRSIKDQGKSSSCASGKDVLVLPCCAIECPGGRPLSVLVVDKKVVLAVDEIGLYFL